MKEKIIAGLLLILVLNCAFLYSDWKKDVKEFLGIAKDYQGLSNYLTTNFEIIPPDDKPTAALIISYSFFMQGKSEMEFLWLKKYFNDYYAKEPSLEFLPVSLSVKILQYRTDWLDRFPGFKNLKISAESEKFNYFSPPKFISLELNLYALSKFKLLDENGKLIKSGELILKKSKIQIPIDNEFIKQKLHKYKIIFETQKYMNERKFTIELNYIAPEYTEFYPEKGILKIKGKEFKKEDEERIRIEKRRYFDSKYFKKKALPYYITGIVFFAGDTYGLKKIYDSDSLNASLQASVDGSRYLVKSFTIGFSLKAIIETINSYKTEVKKIPYTVKIKDAVLWNKKLKSEIEEAKKSVFVELTLKNFEKGGNK